MRGRTRKLLIAALVAAAAVVYLGAVATPAGARDVRAFDPERTAAREVRMWQAYYAKRNVALFGDLVAQARETYRCSWLTATRIAFHLARAAAAFGNLRSDYAQVLPDLDRAYAIAKDWTGAPYAPRAVAQAELAWWVARRVPGQDSPEQVGALMADLYALFYEVPPARVIEAAVLRARAGKLRDQGGADADWVEVSRLLQASYASLHRGVNRE